MEANGKGAQPGGYAGDYSVVWTTVTVVGVSKRGQFLDMFKGRAIRTSQQIKCTKRKRVVKEDAKGLGLSHQKTELPATEMCAYGKKMNSSPLFPPTC